VCDLETSRMGAPYIYDVSRLRVKQTATSANPNPSLRQTTANIQNSLRSR